MNQLQEILDTSNKIVCIYKITSPTNKIYIGQSSNLRKRWMTYNKLRCKEQPKLYNSFIKHGIDNHIFEIIHILPHDVTQIILDNYEILYWQLYKNCGFEVLNVKDPGGNGKHSLETIEKMKKPKTESHKQKLRGPNNHMFGRFGELNHMFGKTHSPEVRNKIRLSVQGKMVGEKHPHYGKKFNKDVVDKIIKNRTGKYTGKSNHASKSINQYTKSGVFIKFWEYATLASNELKIDLSAIIKCCKNKLKSTGGFTWSYT